MDHLKTYEGFFDFFKKKSSEDDKIVQIYIDRLANVKGISPYDIEYDIKNVLERYDDAKVYKYKVNFHDTPIYIMRGKIISPNFSRYSPAVEKELKDGGAVFKNTSEFFQLYLPHQQADVKANWWKLEKLFYLTKKVYENDMEATRIKRIRDDINTSEDL